MTDTKSVINFAFFGTDEFAVVTLGALLEKGYRPSVVVTVPDQPRGRKLILTPPPLKLFAQKKRLEVWQAEQTIELFTNLKSNNDDLFIVASYGRLLPPAILAIPAHGVLNIHPSLLPLGRGPSPIQSAILTGQTETGVTIIKLDDELDHGPMIASQKVNVGELGFQELRDRLAETGADLLAKILPRWIAGEIEPQAQNHDLATFTHKISKEMGELKRGDDPQINYRKFRALTPWPGVYFWATGRQNLMIRVIVKDARLDRGQFIIDRVVPESRQELAWSDFIKNYTPVAK